MRSFSIALILALIIAACAEAQITQTGAGKKAGNFILMVDNTSRILQTDNVSRICLATGC